jgi:hypothetical protein
MRPGRHLAVRCQPGTAFKTGHDQGITVNTPNDAGAFQAADLAAAGFRHQAQAGGQPLARARQGQGQGQGQGNVLRIRARGFLRLATAGTVASVAG